MELRQRRCPIPAMCQRSVVCPDPHGPGHDLQGGHGPQLRPGQVSSRQGCQVRSLPALLSQDETHEGREHMKRSRALDLNICSWCVFWLKSLVVEQPQDFEYIFFYFPFFFLLPVGEKLLLTHRMTRDKGGERDDGRRYINTSLSLCDG